MTASHSVYDLATGLFTGLTLGDSAEFVTGNLPSACGAWPGAHDAARVRVDIDLQVLVSYQPPAPADTALTIWCWDAAAWRWAPSPTTVALAQDVRAERDRRMSSCDLVVARATELGQAVPADWLAYRAALRDVPAQAGFPIAVDWPASPA